MNIVSARGSHSLQTREEALHLLQEMTNENDQAKKIAAVLLAERKIDSLLTFLQGATSCFATEQGILLMRNMATGASSYNDTSLERQLVSAGALNFLREASSNSKCVSKRLKSHADHAIELLVKASASGSLESASVCMVSHAHYFFQGWPLFGSMLFVLCMLPALFELWVIYIVIVNKMAGPEAQEPEDPLVQAQQPPMRMPMPMPMPMARPMPTAVPSNGSLSSVMAALMAPLLVILKIAVEMTVFIAPCLLPFTPVTFAIAIHLNSCFFEHVGFLHLMIALVAGGVAILQWKGYWKPEVTAGPFQKHAAEQFES